MAIRFMTGNPSKFMNKAKKILTQKFNYLLVIDFEATCEKNKAITTPEIIEFPCLAINTKNWEVENSFHKYVKPRVNPILSNFCTDLTGIMQETIDDEEHFPIVFDEFCHWLERNEFIENNKSALVTCGDWDLKVMLPGQCQLDNLIVPDYFKQWIDLKKTYYDTTKHFPKSIRDMLMRLKLPPQERLHSGIHDAISMIRIIEELANKHDAIFELTSKIK